MIKEAGLFVLSAGFLVYFIAPVNDEPEPQSVKTENEQKAARSADEADDSYWGDEEDEEDEVEPEFVFGEPMSSTESNSEYDDSGSYDEEYAALERQPSSSSAASSRDAVPVVARPSRAHKSSPKPGQLGSAENPIPLN